VGAKRRSFDPEFRAGAVRIVKETGKPVAEVARDLGINAYTLHNWVKTDRETCGQDAGGALSEAEREELARLRAPKAQWDKGTRGAADGASQSCCQAAAAAGCAGW
jgi:transposase